MSQCPICNSINGFCEQVDLEKGEVIGYICTECGYDEWDEEDKLMNVR